MDKKTMRELRLEGRTYKYIAEKAGVSRQRIQQLISPPPAIRAYVIKKYSGFCAECGLYVGVSGHVHHNGANGEEHYNDVENLVLLCISCHRLKHCKPPEFHQCRNCGEPIRYGMFCDIKCLSQYHTTTLTCSCCGLKFPESESRAKLRVERSTSGLIFCSNRCQGKWLGEHYGIGRKKVKE